MLGMTRPHFPRAPQHLSCLCLLLCSLVVGTACDSSSSPVRVELPVANAYEGVLSPAQEREIGDALEAYVLANYRATVLVNSLVFADPVEQLLDLGMRRVHQAREVSVRAGDAVGDFYFVPRK